MEALARRHVNGLWIDGLAMSGTRSTMSISGGSVDADIVPAYLRSLSTETVLSGTRFDDFVIERPEKGTHVRFRAGSKSLPVKQTAGYVSAAMKLPVALAKTLARFDALSMRERALVAGASLIGIVLLWVALVFDPMSVKQRALSAELTTLQQSIQMTTLSIQETADADPTLIAQREETKLKTQLADINAQLATKSAGLIPPERMVQVIHDVLSRQHGVRLVSLHNSPVTTLVPSSGPGRAVRRPVRAPGRDRRRRHVPRRACLPARIGKPRVALLLAPARARKHRISPQPGPHRAQHAEPRPGLDRRLGRNRP